MKRILLGRGESARKREENCTINIHSFCDGELGGAGVGGNRCS